jgi:CCR4-NOT transcription complex subunit 7/8
MRQRRPSIEIRQVWASNLEEEFNTISELVTQYPYIGMDTEFPGFIVRNLSAMNDAQRYHVQSINVNLLRIIQVGLAFADRNGRSPTPGTIWQFNFKFSLTEDLYAPDAITLLKDAEIDFAKFERDGIDAIDFGCLLLSSGLVMNNDVVWVSFHGGYDFGYLLKILTGAALPKNENDFFQLLRKYFPHVYDTKYIVSKTEPAQTGLSLSDQASQMQVGRYGTAHQAGSDASVTLELFFRYMQKHYGGVVNNEKFENSLFGL